MHENSGLQAYSERCLLLGKLGYCMASSAGRARRGRQKVLLLLWLLVKDEVARYGPKVRRDLSKKLSSERSANH